jgi:penicillin-binding protein 1A
MGMPIIVEYARRFGVYDNLMPALSMALGAGETTLLRMVTGYSMIDNGGKQIKATFIDRIQDRYGRTIWRHDDRDCSTCAAREWTGQEEPQLVDVRKQIIDPMSAFEMTNIMEGVIQSGTAQKMKVLNRPIAGKTGTTNDYKDAWFIGFTPDLVVGVYFGFDQPATLGHGETGGMLAAPVVRDFMREALADVPPIPFRAPPGIKLVRVNHKTGLPAGPGDKTAILEAFKPGEEPAGSVPEDIGDDSGQAAADDLNTGAAPPPDAAADAGPPPDAGSPPAPAAVAAPPRRQRVAPPPPPPSNALTAGPGGLY